MFWIIFLTALAVGAAWYFGGINILLTIGAILGALWASRPLGWERLKDLYQGQEPNPHRHRNDEGDDQVYYQDINCLDAPDDMEWRHVAMILGSAAIWAVAIWGEVLPVLGQAILALTSFIPIYYLPWIPFQSERLVQIKSNIVPILLGATVVGFFTTFTGLEESIRWGLNFVWIIGVSQMIDRRVGDLPAKHHAVHLRQGRISGWRIPSGGQYLLMVKDQFFPMSDELQTLTGALVEVEIGGEAAVKVPLVVQYYNDRNNWDEEWRLVAYMVPVETMKQGIVEAMTPFLRRIAAVTPTVEEFNKKIGVINLMIRFKFETDDTPHEDEALLASLGCGVGECKIRCRQATIGGASRRVVADEDLVKFYEKFRAELEALLPEKLAGRSKTELQFGRYFAAAGVSIKDVETSEQLAAALEAQQINRALAEGARELEGVSPENLDRVLAARGNATVTRVIIDRGGDQHKTGGTNQTRDDIADGVIEGNIASDAVRASQGNQPKGSKSPRRSRRRKGSKS